ncbi:D-arabinono-1,4-lactone oxidase [Corynebacterium aquatimens]|uniref:FAD-linked oxidoreductase n=1 Tax=Corynebacterium aquatimens TaxID=1190508 RepID=A0A931GW74_9CORY|nr:D-arabinono-1,4-lactone oxidase [Corynebacterium aquatimens]MBG6122206.1 FAD-linked oxidoreductase [Corynebacterium aquatimens]
MSTPLRKQPNRFSNWSGSVTSNPHAVYYPSTISEVADTIAHIPTGETLRTVGGGHSFTPVAAGGDNMMSLDELTGIISVDTERKRVRFFAGTRLYKIPELLKPFGLALANQGDVDRQSVAGAVSTSTHGTGINWTGFAGTVTGLKLVDASGQVREYSIDTNPEELRLVTVTCGALGVIVEVEMQCVDAFDLLAVESSDNFDDILDTWEERCRAVDHFECFWFPHTDDAMVKNNTRYAPGEAAEGGDPKPRTKFTQFVEDEVVGNGAFAASLAFTRRVPSMVPKLNALSTSLIANNSYRGRAHEIFISPRRVKFHEMEFAVPLAAGPDAVREIRKAINDNNWMIPFPVELRCTATDDVALSTSTGRESTYIAIHVPKYMDPSTFFPTFQDILLAHDGRPHWGKMHTLTHADFSKLYPRFDEFCTLREQMDPDRRFGSPHLNQIFG